MTRILGQMDQVLSNNDIVYCLQVSPVQLTHMELVLPNTFEYPFKQSEKTRLYNQFSFDSWGNSFSLLRFQAKARLPPTSESLMLLNKIKTLLSSLYLNCAFFRKRRHIPEHLATVQKPRVCPASNTLSPASAPSVPVGHTGAKSLQNDDPMVQANLLKKLN